MEGFDSIGARGYISRPIGGTGYTEEFRCEMRIGSNRLWKGLESLIVS